MKNFQISLIAALIISPFVCSAVLVLVSMLTNGEPDWGKSITTGVVIGVSNVLIQYTFAKKREQAKARKHSNVTSNEHSN